MKTLKEFSLDLNGIYNPVTDKQVEEANNQSTKEDKEIKSSIPFKYKIAVFFMVLFGLIVVFGGVFTYLAYTDQLKLFDIAIPMCPAAPQCPASPQCPTCPACNPVINLNSTCSLDNINLYCNKTA